MHFIVSVKKFDHFVGMVESSLNFSSAQFKLPDTPEIEPTQLQAWQHQVTAIDLIPCLIISHWMAHIIHILMAPLFVIMLSQTLCGISTITIRSLSSVENVQIFDAYFANARDAVFKFLDKLNSKKSLKNAQQTLAIFLYQHATVLQIQSLFQSVANTTTV